MSLSQQTRDTFAPGGAIASSQKSYQPREGQLSMAVAVAEAIEAGESLVVEAGTGIGKTYAYLVPALLSGKRVILSTATRTLQDQLYRIDLPRVARSLGIPLRTAQLKGRGSYLCLLRLEQFPRDRNQDTPVLHTLARVERWAASTSTGDWAELPATDERSAVLSQLTSTRESCAGTSCPRVNDCHLYRARREAMGADVVVVNHHLVFADLQVRESGFTALLPAAPVMIFDEAHQLVETGAQCLGIRFSSATMIECARRCAVAGLQLARGLGDWVTLAAAMEQAARDLRMCLGICAQGIRVYWAGEGPDGVEATEWRRELDAVVHACQAMASALAEVDHLSSELDRLAADVRELEVAAARFSQPSSADTIRWLEAGQHVQLVESPLDIALAVQQHLLSRVDDGAVARTVVLTSATLGSDPSLQSFKAACGLENARTLCIPSPFDYPRQAALYIPPDLAPPEDAAHSNQLADLVARSARVLGGSTLVLTTTTRALDLIGKRLRAVLRLPGDPEVLVQGEWARSVLLERFRSGANAGTGEGGLVLVASASFWEGVDVPGPALRLLVIDKLPFPPPDDPWVAARTRQLESIGRSPFAHFALPAAALALRQGAGRLIRRETDQGVLVIGDIRLRSKGYRKRLLTALPPLRYLDSPSDYQAALEALTKSSTTDPNWV